MLKFIKHLVACAAAAAVVAAGPASADNTRPITLIASADVGGLIDVVARAYADALSKELSQTVVVQNRGGAGGVVAANALAKSRPDGETLCFCFNGPVALAKATVDNLPYDIDTAFLPVARVYSIGPVIAVPINSRFTSLSSILEAVRSGADLNYGHTGNSGASNLGMQEIAFRTNLKFNGVAYPSESKVLVDLVGERLDIGVLSPMLAKTQADAKRVRLIAGMGKEPVFPNLPAAGDMPELKGFVAPSWAGFFLPAGTPDAAMRRLYAAIQKASQNPAVRERLAAYTVQPVLNETPEEFRKLIEVDKKAAVDTVKRIGKL